MGHVDENADVKKKMWIWLKSGTGAFLHTLSGMVM